jgi:hypothetical protein
MKKYNYLVVALMLIIFIACHKDSSNGGTSSTSGVNLTDTTSIKTNTSSPLMDTLSIKMAETVMSGDITIKLDNVNEGRCPKNVTCVWAGFADAKLIVQKGAYSQVVQLKTVSKLDTAVVLNRHFRLLSVSPYPIGATQIPQSDYVVKLLVQ